LNGGFKDIKLVLKQLTTIRKLDSKTSQHFFQITEKYFKRYKAIQFDERTRQYAAQFVAKNKPFTQHAAHPDLAKDSN
jgi:hypothetical protein